MLQLKLLRAVAGQKDLAGGHPAQRVIAEAAAACAGLYLALIAAVQHPFIPGGGAVLAIAAGGVDVFSKQFVFRHGRGSFLCLFLLVGGFIRL